MAGQQKSPTPVAVTQLLGSIGFSFISVLRRAAEIREERKQREAEEQEYQEYRKVG